MERPSSVWIIPAIVVCGFLTSQVYAETVPTGSHEFSLKQDGRERTYLLHVPLNYDGAKQLPLVMFFHGGMGTAKHAEEHYGWSEKADAESFTVVYANGTGTFQTWNAIHGCGSAFKNNVDDVGFVKAILKDLEAKVKIDPKRIFATGMSNGAMLTHRLGAEMPLVFAAVAPVAGTIGGKENADAKEKRVPEPGSPVAIIIFHGKADQNVRYDGGPTKAGVEKGRIDLSVAESVNFWVKANGCNATPKKDESKNGNIITEIYASDKGADVELCTIVNGAHAWPGGKRTRLKLLEDPTQDISATDMAWDFFAAHPKK